MIKDAFARGARTLDAQLGLELRALALWRMLAAGLILADLAWRAFDLSAMYTDEGLLPRQARQALWAPQAPSLSLHMLSGHALAQGVLFVAAALAAVGMGLGYKTPWMVALSWLLLTSLHARNPVVLHRGDMALRVMMFWSMWLPLGQRWSLDARQTLAADDARAPRPPGRVGGLAAWAITAQWTALYWVSVMHKDGLAWRAEGTAVYYALQLDDFVTPLGRWLGQRPSWSAPLTAMTLALELAAPALLWAPWPRAAARRAAIALGIALHGGLMLTMRLDLFMPIMMAGWLVFWPGVSAAQLPAQAISPAPTPRAWRAWRAARAGVVSCALLASLAWSVDQTAPQPRQQALGPALRAVGLVQRWSMFAPEPARDDGWLMVVAHPHHDEPGGRELLRGLELDAASLGLKPQRMDTHNLRWRAYFMAVARDDSESLRPWLLRWACVTLRYEHEPTAPPGQTPERWTQPLGELTCSP